MATLIRMTGLIRSLLKAGIYSALGAAVVLVVGFVLYMNGRADLDVWHLVRLDEEFNTRAQVNNFAEYLALEDRLFRQLDEQVYAKVTPEQKSAINRYSRDSLSDPHRWERNWNRSFELPAGSAQASVLLLHGMSDSPYSLRYLGERLNAAGAHVLGLRMPGHGTAPSGLVDITWQDMSAAVRLAIRHLADQHSDTPLYIVGYSTGAALAVQYALDSQEDPSLPRVKRLVLISPAIGVSAVASLAVWQARLGRLLGLEKLVWNEILPEYDPFKYQSFAVNAGDVVYQLTSEIQDHITSLQRDGKLEGLPPVLAFASIVDATVSTEALVEGLFERLPAGGHELVLFDINRSADIDPLLRRDPAIALQKLKQDRGRSFKLSFVTNETESGPAVIVRRQQPGSDAITDTPLGLSWPPGLYSLAHVALPFPPDDPVYGGLSPRKSPGIRLGNIALRGERGILTVSPSDMLRLRWNPFYPYLEERVFDFLELDRARVEAPSPGFVPDRTDLDRSAVDYRSPRGAVSGGPHGSLGRLTPSKLAKRSQESNSEAPKLWLRAVRKSDQRQMPEDSRATRY